MNTEPAAFRAIDRAIELLNFRGARASADELASARADLAELIESDKAYNVALVALEEHYRLVAESGYLAATHSNGRELSEHFVHAQVRRAAALARAQGGVE